MLKWPAPFAVPPATGTPPQPGDENNRTEAPGSVEPRMWGVLSFAGDAGEDPVNVSEGGGSVSVV